MARTLIDVWRGGGDCWLAVVFHPTDPDTGAERILPVTDAPALYTGPGAAPPGAHYTISNRRFVTRLMPSWTLKRSVAASGNITGPSSIESATFDLENGDGSLTFLKGLTWADCPFEVYMGAERGPDGARIGIADFLPIMSGVTTDCQGAAGTISITALGRKSALDNPLMQTYLRGFGMGVLVPAHLSPPSRLVGAPSGDHNLAAPATVEWVGRITGPHLGTSWAPLYQCSNFYGLILDASGHLGFVTGATAADTSSVRFSSYQPPTGCDLYLAAVVAADGTTVSLYSREGVATALEGFRSGELRLVGTLSMPVALSKTDPAAGTPLVGWRDSSNAVGVHAYEIRLRAVALGYDDLLAASEAPLPAGGAGVTGLVDAWRFGEGTGATAYSELRLVDLALEGAATWSPSLDGDDPAVFPGGPLGQTEPTCFGPCLQLPLVLRDTQTRTYGWRGADLDSGERPSYDIWGRLRANGAPLVPDESIVLGSGTVSFAFDDPHVILLSGTDLATGRPMTAKRLVPGQASPALTGQRIDVVGSAHNDRTLTVAPDGISADGLEIRVVETLVSEAVVSPSPLTIRTTAADRQYTYDLATSTARLISDVQAGSLGIDASGGLAASYSASALFAAISAGAVDTSALTWDPVLAFGHLLGESTTRKAILDAVALSAMAWWVEDEAGTFRLVTIRPPTGSPGRLFREEVASIRPLSSTTPFSRITVGYAKNYHPVDKGTIPGSVPANLRERLSQPLLTMPRPAKPETTKRFRQAKPRSDPFETYLLAAADAARWLDLAAPVFLEERRWWEVTLAGAWVGAAAVKPGDEHRFVYGPSTGLFESGADARIMSTSVAKGTDRTVLEVLT